MEIALPTSLTECGSPPAKTVTHTATLRRVEGEPAAGTGDDGQTILEGALVSTGREAQMTDAGDYRFFAGWRSDPFFFDTLGALNNLQFTGNDFFAEKDVCSIVLEVPTLPWARERLACGIAHSMAATGNGFKRIAARAPRNLCS